VVKIEIDNGDIYTYTETFADGVWRKIVLDGNMLTWTTSYGYYYKKKEIVDRQGNKTFIFLEFEEGNE
jgi:hypothetical protein